MCSGKASIAYPMIIHPFFAEFRTFFPQMKFLPKVEKFFLAEILKFCSEKLFPKKFTLTSRTEKKNCSGNSGLKTG